MMSLRERERTEVYRKKAVMWTNKEILALLYLVQNIGKASATREVQGGLSIIDVLAEGYTVG